MVVLYPLAFYRRSKRPWKSRVVASRKSDHDAAPANLGNECCPNCCLPAAKPLCRGIFTGASLNTIGCAKLVSSVGLVVFILCWSREGANTVGLHPSQR